MATSYNNGSSYNGSLAASTSTQQLLTLGSLGIGLLMFLFTPWLVRKLPEGGGAGGSWWIEYAPFWDAPHEFARQSVYPYCPEGHACFFLTGIQIVALCVLHNFLHRRLGDEEQMRGAADYSAYRRQQRETRSR